MNRTEVMDAAKSCVCGDRDHDYGGPEKSFECISAMWGAYLRYSTGVKIAIDPHDVAAMMAMLKLARIAKNPEKADSWVDLAGYAACGGECATHDTTVRVTRYAPDFNEDGVCVSLHECERCTFTEDAICALRKLNPVTGEIEQ